jgi:hypothetical protein
MLITVTTSQKPVKTCIYLQLQITFLKHIQMMKNVRAPHEQLPEPLGQAPLKHIVFVHNVFHAQNLKGHLFQFDDPSLVEQFFGLGRYSPNIYQDFIRFPVPVSTTCIFSTWRDIPDS